MTRWTTVAVVLGLTTTCCRADFGDGAVEHYVDDSELGVRATLTRSYGGVVEEAGWIVFQLDFCVEEALHGSPPDDDPIRVLAPFAHLKSGDHVPELEVKVRYLLFLKRQKSMTKDGLKWGSAGLWFGLQRYNSMMELQVKRAAKRQPNGSRSAESGPGA